MAARNSRLASSETATVRCQNGSSAAAWLVEASICRSIGEITLVADSLGRGVASTSSETKATSPLEAVIETRISSPSWLSVSSPEK